MKINCFVILLLLSFSFYGQGEDINPRILQTTKGAGVGLLGAWAFHESPITNNLVLQGEIGYIGSLYGRSSGGVDNIFTASFELESKYYYNIRRRSRKGKNLNYNAANFFSISVTSVPDFLTHSSVEFVRAEKTIAVIPKYGFRRIFEDRVSFDFGFGVGQYWSEFGYSDTAIALDLRIFYLW